MKKFESYSNNTKILTELFFLVVNGLWLNCLSFSGIKSLFVLVIGMKKSDQWELQEERDKRMQSEYYDPIEGFPEKVDQLLEVLS